jgi:hypothetical protein
MPITAADAIEAAATGAVGKGSGSGVDVGSGEGVAVGEGVAIGEGDGLGEGVGEGDGVGSSGVPYPIGVYCSFNALGYMNVM